MALRKTPWGNSGGALGEEQEMVLFGGALFGGAAMESGQGINLESGYSAPQQKQTQQHGLVAVGNGSEAQLPGAAHHDIRGIWPIELSFSS
ncbi:hypothetical protein [Specibacter sp. NPDC078692]|uniref:hypothetical protein n=1 Tax=Specibacter sp. NPDC078692 TaxID=3155818 RepID=UPI00341974DF